MSGIASLLQTPLLWIAATLLVFEGADRISRRSNRHPLAHPVLMSVPVLAVILYATGTPYRTYAQGTATLTFLLGPATVSLAVPLWRNWPLVRQSAKAVLAALLAGSVTAIVSAVTIAWAFGASPAVLATLAPHSATTPVGMAIAEGIGGIPALAAVAILITGILGAMVATPLLNWLKITDQRARGFAVGVTAHGLGTARAFQVSETAGTFAGMAMALNAATTALLLSLVALL
ncbi:LrgB family protein [Sphingomonas desiccabilis]|uniref:LrgB family protein n=1 Tax=Sphingomonas desiccabilis TaxID=429134 RepID=A0A4V1QNM4_9SPHN|nr:LrgB family protein [Sphingomonas desiccabilis]MBB3912646.1 putative murein hydrolase (TIGR00659 family) [Sphingomonas desiccabilis]RXZ29929.1 LrgB family protein [Sphingomonas desiccabilis]